MADRAPAVSCTRTLSSTALWTESVLAWFSIRLVVRRKEARNAVSTVPMRIPQYDVVAGVDQSAVKGEIGFATRRQIVWDRSLHAEIGRLDCVKVPSRTSARCELGRRRLDDSPRLD